ncbi:hypothetical protein G5714_010697 [Onychostoma macrolepis]|uniref:Uncharacterized protein n=1 Tax=Onychostoma macrolepis TaxID=369639 RepID=A0A7J6CKT1_9TELE|nr:hypothetical protein G5714_010697 [Onychostoma macrolepis]
MQTQRADHCPRPSAHTGPTTKEWSEAESGSPSLYASWGATRQTMCLQQQVASQEQVVPEPSTNSLNFRLYVKHQPGNMVTNTSQYEWLFL